jgi:hypothetical protein
VPLCYERTDRRAPEGKTDGMKLEHARRLQRALIDQQHARDELIHASSDEQTIASATAFMAAIRAACVVAAQVELAELEDTIVREGRDEA